MRTADPILRSFFDLDTPEEIAQVIKKKGIA